MKVVILAVSMLAIVGCSTAPSKLERIEANEAAISGVQSQVDANSKAIEINKTMNGNMNTKIDRMFEKSQYK
jgi:hypothetical protein